MGDVISVLHVEDDAAFASLTAEYLEQVDEALRVETVGRVDAAADRICDPRLDCVVSDFDLPESDGIDLLERVRRVDDRLPFILFTGKGSEEVASDALAAGATDYLQKERGAGQFAVLANRIENAVARHRAVKALERQNDRHEKAESIANLGTWELDLRTEEVWLSTGGYRSLGLPADYEPTPRSGLANYHPDDRRAIVEAVEQAIENRESVDTEARYVGGDGDCQWVRVRGDPQVEGGEVVRLRATIQDVTRHKERESELERYETIVQAAGDPVYRLDPAGRFTFVNDAMLAETGYDRTDLLGSHVSRYIDDEDFERGREIVRSLRDDEQCRRGTMEVDVIGVDGERTPCEVHVALLPASDGVRGTVGVVRSVESCKQRQRELRRYEAIMETVPVGVLFLDAEGRVEAANERAESIVGLDRSDWVGVSFDVLVERGIVSASARDTFLDTLCELLDHDGDDGVTRLEAEISPHDVDGTVLIDVHVTLLPYDCEFDGAVGIFQDVTDQRAHERALERKTERLEEFANIVSHDLRNPLNVAQSRLELARRDGLDADHLAVAGDALDDVGAIIDDTLTLARLGDTVDSPERVDVVALARQAWPDPAGARLLVPEEVTIDGDPSRLRAALSNLFENAVTHGTNGSGKMSAGTETESTVTVRVGEVGNRGFYVADDGPGIPSEEREQIFEPGYTTAPRGTGFGLAIVDQVASAHGWAVSVEESDEGGARVEFTADESEFDAPLR